MKYKIEGQKEKVEEKVAISLRINGNGNVFIIARDAAAGLDWYLLELRTDGTFCRCTRVSNDIGFQVNKNGRIKENKQ